MAVLDRSTRTLLVAGWTGWIMSISACDDIVTPPEAPVESVDAPWTEETPLPFAGWLDATISPIVPWCGVTLVAPDVALTAADCFDENIYGRVNAGFGALESAAHEVVDVITLHGAPELAALVLDPPVRDIEPARSTTATQGCAFESISYTHVVRGTAESHRWSWFGCLAPAPQGLWLTPKHGEPNCHGELGAGAFDEHGKLVGISVAADPGPECVKALLLAPTADVLDEALAASSWHGPS